MGLEVGRARPHVERVAHGPQEGGIQPVGPRKGEPRWLGEGGALFGCGRLVGSFLVTSWGRLALGAAQIQGHGGVAGRQGGLFLGHRFDGPPSVLLGGSGRGSWQAVGLGLDDALELAQDLRAVRGQWAGQEVRGPVLRRGSLVLGGNAPVGGAAECFSVWVHHI